jgi:hypothetical protein
MKPIPRTALTIANVVSLVAAVYYFWPGFEHVGTSGTGSQPTLGALCTAIFLIVFLTAAQLTSKHP